MKSFIILSTFLIFSMLTDAAISEEEIEVVLEGLKNPCGVAVQPGSGDIFVSDTAAGKIVRVVDGKAEDVITGSAQDVYGQGPKYDIGPLGIAFLDRKRLVVGDGGFPDGEEFIRVFEVPDKSQPAISYDQGIKVGALTAEGNRRAEGNLYGVAITPTNIFCTCNGDDTKGWVATAKINGEKFGSLKRFIATKEEIEIDAPVGITISPRGEVVIGQMGEINVENDSQLTFYNAKSGKMLMNVKTGLHDITALAYSPRGHLYALDFAWMSLENGGLFRLDKQGNGINAVKIMSFDKPTAMTFSEDGSLLITEMGVVTNGEQSGAGRLMRLEAGL